MRKLRRNIGYHVRLTNGTKVCGGSFGGDIDMETVNRLVNVFFTVSVTTSGRAVFVDKQGREVLLTITVDPDRTDQGISALEKVAKERRAWEAVEEQRQEEIDSLLSCLSSDEIITRLKRE